MHGVGVIGSCRWRTSKRSRASTRLIRKIDRGLRMMFGSDPLAGTITERPIGITSGGGCPCRPTRGCRTRVNWPGGSFPITSRTSWPRSRSAAAWSSACSTTAPQKDHENGTTMPTFISARVYARPAQCTDAARRRSPRDADHRRRTAQRRLLHPRARAAAGEEDGQPGRPDRLPPLLRGREGQRRLGHHVLRVSGRDARQGRPGDGPHDRLAGRLGRRARLLGAAAAGRGRERRPLGREPHVRGPGRASGTSSASSRPTTRRSSRGIRRSRRSTRCRASTASAPTRSTPSAAPPCSRTRSASPPAATSPGRRAATSAAAGTPTTRRPRGAASPAPGRCTTSRGRRRSRITTRGSSASPRPVTGRRR